MQHRHATTPSRYQAILQDSPFISVGAILQHSSLARPHVAMLQQLHYIHPTSVVLVTFVHSEH